MLVDAEGPVIDLRVDVLIQPHRDVKSVLHVLKRAASKNLPVEARSYHRCVHVHGEAVKDARLEVSDAAHSALSGPSEAPAPIPGIDFDPSL